MGGESSTPEPPPPPPKLEYDEEWRETNWSTNQRDDMVAAVRNFKLYDPEVGQLRVLLLGPVGAGKSSFINSVNNVFQGRIAHVAEAAAASGKSFTKIYKTHYIRNAEKILPCVFNDVMGLEAIEEDGVHPDDIINAMNGHLPEGYKFNPYGPLTAESGEYNKNPSSHEKVHCLVNVIPADKISLISNRVINKMKKVRENASELGIPQVVVMTMPDTTCPLVQRDLKKIYTSKAIKAKMQMCSNALGVPMTNILPVKNYHEENRLNDNMDILILNATTHIMNLANDYQWSLKPNKFKKLASAK